MTNKFKLILLFNVIFTFDISIQSHLMKERGLLAKMSNDVQNYNLEQKKDNNLNSTNSKEKPVKIPLDHLEPNLSRNRTLHKTISKQESHIDTNAVSVTGTQDNAKITSIHHSWNIEQESGFLTNTMTILLLISLIFMVFVAYKTYRRKSRNARIKKYGVRLTRGNIEMTPLPLDNDDDDETVFDLKNVPT
ncbi:hypothetical protein HHI36_002373 [Cryptolaemus montrouzieri]|uniref:Uncharacterized protein n=1 Tax=Cryptolaemus montrouzieri TaxID=559131 RepID=A0ABD2PA83_9CUCU